MFHNIYKQFIIGMLTITALLLPLVQQPAYAHRVTVFAWVEDGMVFTESKFGAGAKVNNGKIIVYDKAGQELLSGQTDTNGEFAFPIPAQSELKIVLDATMGHRAEWIIPVSEISDQAEQETPQTVSTKTSQPSITPQDNQQNTEQLEAAIEKILDRKLKPITHLLAELNQTGPSLHDIIAGLGYIVGLIGVAAWVNSRKKSS